MSKKSIAYKAALAAAERKLWNAFDRRNAFGRRQAAAERWSEHHHWAWIPTMLMAQPWAKREVPAWVYGALCPKGIRRGNELEQKLEDAWVRLERLRFTKLVRW